MGDQGALLTIPSSTWAALLKESKPSVYMLHRAGWIAGFSINGIFVKEAAAVGPQEAR